MGTQAELDLVLQLKNEGRAVAEEVKRDLEGIGLRARDLNRGLVDVGNVLGKGLLVGAAAGVAGLAAGVGALATTIGPASDLAETANKVRVVFGEGADAVLKFGEGAATALGMSKQEALAAAGTYGNLLRSMGITEKASAGMSMSLVRLASDLASFNNMDPSEVLEKLRAGLTGETEPLKALGVNLNEAAIKAKAMEMGLWDGKGALDTSAKAWASYSIIMEQTALAQGDFARTSNGLANQQRILKATFADLKVTVGTAVLPVVNALMSRVTDVIRSEGFQEWLKRATDALAELGEALSQILSGDLASGLTRLFGPDVASAIMGIVNGLQRFASFVQANLGPVLAGLAATVLTAVVPAFASWAAAAIPAAAATVAAMAPVLAIMAAVGVAAGLLVAAWRNDWGGIRTTLTEVWENTLRPALETLRAWLEENIPKAVDSLAGIWNNVLQPALRAVWSFLSEYLFPLLGAVAEVLGAVLYKAAEALAGLFVEVVAPALKEAWKWLSDLAKEIGERLQPLLNWLGEHVLPPIARAFRAVGDAVRDAIGWLSGLADKILNLRLPDWLTPGSPTPLELGLRGIAAAMRDLSAIELPRMGLRLSEVGRSRYAALDYDRLGRAVASAVGSRATYQIVANYRYQDERSLRDDLRLLQLLSSAT